MKRYFFLKIILFAGLVFCVERFCHRATDGFALVNIHPPKETVYPSASFSLDKEIKTVLDQPFNYLASGSQSYVFVSQDQSVVFKLFKFQHMRIPPWMEKLPLPSFLEKKRSAKKAKKKALLLKTLTSYALAYNRMKNETGLLYVHLSPTKELQKILTLKSKIGKTAHLDLDETVWILQKKADLVYPTLTKWMESGEVKKAEAGIRNLLELACSRCKKGLFDKDPDFSTNFGFIEDAPVQIDVGRLTEDSNEANPLVYKEEMIRITRDLEVWIEKKHPDLLPYFKNEICNLGDVF